MFVPWFVLDFDPDFHSRFELGHILRLVAIISDMFSALMPGIWRFALD